MTVDFPEFYEEKSAFFLNFEFFQSRVQKGLTTIASGVISGSPLALFCPVYGVK